MKVTNRGKKYKPQIKIKCKNHLKDRFTFLKNRFFFDWQYIEHFIDREPMEQRKRYSSIFING